MVTMTPLLAIAPVVPLLLVLAAGGGLFAFLRKRKRTPADPGQIAAAPFVNLTSSTTTAMLEYAAGLYRWTVAGPVQAVGSDADSGKAVLAMAQALAASEDGATVMGEIGGPGHSTLELTVEPDDDEWSWTVTSASKLPSPVPGTPSPPTVLAGSRESSRSIALLQALQAAADNTDWITRIVPGLDSGGMPVPTPDPVVTLPGIKVVGNSLIVTSLPAWIAYEAPQMRAEIATTHTADEIMDGELAGGADLPTSAKLNNRPIEIVRTRFAAELDKVREGSYRGVAEPDAQLSAMVVGAQFPDNEGWVGGFNGYTILVRKAAKTSGGGGFAPVGDQWEWLAWTGEARGYDADAVATGKLPLGRTRSQAIRRARQGAFANFSCGGDNALPPGGGGGGDDGGDQPDPIVPAIVTGLIGDFGPDAGITFQPEDRTIKLPLTKWTDRATKEIEVFDFATGNNASRKNWRIAIGVCIDPEGTNQFGELSEVGGGDVPDAGAFGDPWAWADQHVKLRNMPEGGGIGGTGAPVQWSQFAPNATYKAQLEASFVAGPVIQWSKKLAEITGSSTGEQVDPCPDIDGHWPTPAEQGGFLATILGNASPTTWQALPSFRLVWKKAKLMLQVSYSGIPVFAKNSNGNLYANATAIPRLNLTLRVWAGGSNS